MCLNWLYLCINLNFKNKKDRLIDIIKVVFFKWVVTPERLELSTQ